MRTTHASISLDVTDGHVHGITLVLQGEGQTVTVRFDPHAFVDFITFLVDNGAEVKAQWHHDVDALLDALLDLEGAAREQGTIGTIKDQLTAVYLALGRTT